MILQVFPRTRFFWCWQGYLTVRFARMPACPRLLGRACHIADMMARWRLAIAAGLVIGQAESGVFGFNVSGDQDRVW